MPEKSEMKESLVESIVLTTRNSRDITWIDLHLNCYQQQLQRKKMSSFPPEKKKFNTKAMFYCLTNYDFQHKASHPAGTQETLLNESMSLEQLTCPIDYATVLHYEQSQNTMNSAAQKESYDYLGNDQEGISSDLRGQEVTLISMLLKKKKTLICMLSQKEKGY